jgi:hypothetical protein
MAMAALHRQKGELVELSAKEQTLLYSILYSLRSKVSELTAAETRSKQPREQGIYGDAD